MPALGRAQALLIAAAAVQTVQFVGLPECQLNLAQAVTYIATAVKSNACTVAIGKARADVRSVVEPTWPAVLYVAVAKCPYWSSIATCRP
jgi:replication-associated recombination protein RarA